MDSIGKAENFDRLAKNFFVWKSGYLPYKFLNIDLSRIILYNDYEGFRFGLAVHTNHTLSEKASLGGYMAYGFKDKELKYGGNLRLSLFKPAELEMNFIYKNDVKEHGIEEILVDKSWFSDAYLRSFLI